MNMVYTLTMEQVELLRVVLDFVGGMPTCADELLDCTMDEFNDLEEVFQK